MSHEKINLLEPMQEEEIVFNQNIIDIENYEEIKECPICLQSDGIFIDTGCKHCKCNNRIIHIKCLEHLKKMKFHIKKCYICKKPLEIEIKSTSINRHSNCKKIKQYINKFNKSVNYKIILTSENVINSISKIHLAQKTNSNLNNNNNKRHSHFENKEYFDFLTELYSKNRNVLTYLLVDSDKKDEIICYFTGYIFKNKFHSVSTAVNPKYNYLSVGRIFNYLIFKENSYDKKWNIFDMGAGRYEWKFELTNSYKLLYTFHFKNYKTNKMKFLSKIERILSATKHILKN